MLEKSDTNISGVLKAFNAVDVEVGLIVPTETAMRKGIMDATVSVCTYLAEKKYHNYEAQGQGQKENGVIRTGYFVRPDTLDKTTVSMYRPTTKDGDPRIWFYGLPRYAEPYNLLAMVVDGEDFFIVNCSDAAVMASLHNPRSPLGQLVARRRPDVDPAVVELLDMIREISRKGFVPTLRAGDTGIGMTLETMLGIKANAKKAPDYKGIEIKAKRIGARASNRVTLFSQVPNWSLSPIGTAWNLLSTYGYTRNGKLRLNHEIDAKAPNSLGFYLQVDATKDWLKQNHLEPGITGLKHGKHVTTWELETLRTRLSEKHPRTFWVGARVRGGRDAEEFHYVEVQHTRQPNVRNFEALLEGGLISVDYLMSQKGPKSVRDHGYLFKINPRDFDALFPPAEVHVFA